MKGVIEPVSAGKVRIHLSRDVILTIRKLALKSMPDQDSRDMAAFIALALSNIYKTIDATVKPWEKRNYWVKADKFRMEWAWTAQFATMMKKATIAEDWDQVSRLIAQITQRLAKIKVPTKMGLNCPWTGAWDEINRK